MLQGRRLVQLAVLKTSALTNENYSFGFGIDVWPWLFWGAAIAFISCSDSSVCV